MVSVGGRQLQAFEIALVGVVSLLVISNLYTLVQLKGPWLRRKRRFVVLLVRHGQSTANKDPTEYKKKPDSRIELTLEGEEMARRSGEFINNFLQKEFGCRKPIVTLWVSPFLRTRQTAEKIAVALHASGLVVRKRESPLLVEQDWGLFEGTGIFDAKDRFPDEYERCNILKSHQGKFWARFPLGESCFDVCQRVQTFFGSIMRDRFGMGSEPGSDVAIVVSHGVTIRAFVMMWCHLSPEWFESSPNPPNCSVRVLDTAHKTIDRGYVFAGWDRASSIDSPADLCTLQADTKQAARPPLVTQDSIFVRLRRTISV